MNTDAGKLYIVGFGPGNISGMTIRAREVIEESEAIVGFSTYTELMSRYFPDKDYISTGMGQETGRVRTALKIAAGGKTVSLICSGDSCIYGMAGLAYEMSHEYPGVYLETVPGVTAALSGSALLGAAAGNDLCIISLSDYHTSWDMINRRLRMAAECDLVIALYNPRSKARPDSLKKACLTLMEVLPGDRVCGIAENIGRDEESSAILTLEKLQDYDASMFTTAFIGNSKTRNIDGKMVTPRGYRFE